MAADSPAAAPRDVLGRGDPIEPAVSRPRRALLDAGTG